MKPSTIKRLERQLKESVKVTPVPMMSMNPDTFSGPAPKSVSKGACGCSCPACANCTAKMEDSGGDCGCGCGGQDANGKPVNLYSFTGKALKGADPELPLGYSQPRFLSLLQAMVAPLPVRNKPGVISVVASPALEKGLGALALKEGLEMTVYAKKANEGSCS